MKKLFGRLNADIRGIIYVIAALMGLYAAFVLFLAAPPKTRTGVSLLPPPTCPGGGGRERAKPLDREYKVGLFEIRYANKGCNALSDQVVSSIANTFNVADKRLNSIGFPSPRVHTTIGVLVQPDQPVQVFSGPRNSALYVDGGLVGSNGSPIFAAQGLAEIGLVSTSPGLTSWENERAAAAAAILAVGGGQSYYREILARGGITANTVGLFDAWIASQGGYAAMQRALFRCIRRCQYSKEFRRELAKDHFNMKAQARAFAGRATPARYRSKLVDRIMSSE